MARWGLLCLATLLFGVFPATALAVDGIDASPSTLTFSQEVGAGASSQTSTVTNHGTTRTIDAVTKNGPDGPDFTVLTGGLNDCSSTVFLLDGQSCEVRVEFDPTATGLKSASIDVATEDAGPSGTATITLSGEATNRTLTGSPTTLPFGNQAIGAGPTTGQTSQISNNGAGAVTLGTPVIGGTDAADFQFATPSAPTDCAPGQVLLATQSCDIRLVFDPTFAEEKTAHVTVPSDAPSIQVDLTGRGTLTSLTRSRATIDLNRQDIDENATAPAEATVTNSGSETVTFTGIDVADTDAADFRQAPFTMGDCTATTSLAAGETCKLRYTFDPATVGQKSATITVSSNAPAITVGLAGEGTQTSLGISPKSIPFGNREIAGGPSAAQEGTVSNTGTEPVSFSSVAIGGPEAGQFAQLTGQSTDCSASTMLMAGQTCKLRLRFDPSTVGTKAAVISITTSSAGSLSVSLEGTGTQTELSRSVGSISAGSQDVDDGPTTPQEATFTNTGTEDVTISGADVTGDFSQATGQGSDCTPSRVLHAGETCTLRVQFDPSAVGARTGTARVHSNIPDIVVALDGTGIQTSLSHDPTAVDFKVHTVGSGATDITESIVTNSGTEPVTLSAIRLVDPGAARFLRVSGTPSDCEAGATLSAGQTCKLRAMFVPQSAGAKTGTMTLTSNAGVATLVLTGTGTPRLTIPAFGGKAGSTTKRRLKVNVTVAGGTLRNVVIQVKSRSGRLLGTGTLSSVSRTTRAVTVVVNAPLKPGSYVATARGRDALGNAVRADARNFRLR